MRYSFGLLFVLATTALIGGCRGTVTAPGPDITAGAYFFPFDNGLLYTYSRSTNTNNVIRYDTIVCRIVVGPSYLDANALVNTGTNTPLYRIRMSRDANGNAAALMEWGDTTLYALDGPLVPTATWIADPVNGIVATVVDRYDEYYLQGRLENFKDVIEVKYHQTGQPENVYTIRFFARNNGLILERQLAGPGTEIASLQLLGIRSPS